MFTDYDTSEEFLESFDSLKQAGASLDLHESSSCSCLLPCGLLPEELAELESSCLASSLQVDAALKGFTISDASEGPLTPVTSNELPGQRTLARSAHRHMGADLDPADSAEAAATGAPVLPTDNGMEPAAALALAPVAVLLGPAATGGPTSLLAPPLLLPPL